MHFLAGVFLGFAYLAMRCDSRSLLDVNEILKNRVPVNSKIPPDVLEAFYYQKYGDIGSLATWRRSRPGDASTKHTCADVRAVPQHFRDPQQMKPRGISRAYQKYTEAYGIPVVGTEAVPDRALTRACYVLRFLLADRADLRQRYYHSYGRVAVIAAGAALRTIPEYGFLPSAYEIATSGLGAVPLAPVSTAREENVLCYSNDTNGVEDILVRELAHGIRQLAVRYVIPGLQRQLEELHANAVASGLWRQSYARLSPDAYFGEGVQSYFNANAYANPANGYNNAINTRHKLRTYDPALFLLVQKIFPCANNYIKRCSTRGNEDFQLLRMNCPLARW